MWCGAGSNRRHQDFQSCALPTELPHHPLNKQGKKQNSSIHILPYLFSGCKFRFNFDISQ
jgi:hypothetical protein